MGERVQIGKVGKSHGIDGAFFIEQPSADDRWWKIGSTFGKKCSLTSLPIMNFRRLLINS